MFNLFVRNVGSEKKSEKDENNIYWISNRRGDNNHCFYILFFQLEKVFEWHKYLSSAERGTLARFRIYYKGLVSRGFLVV